MFTPIPLCAAICFIVAVASAQTPAVRPTAAVNQSSVTVQQIVARQQETYKRIRSAEGEVIWRTEDFTKNPTSATQETRVIFFALEAGKSVNLVVTADEALNFPRRREARDWTKVISAAFVEGETVQMITVPRGSAAPEVRPTAFNPAIHENNPLISFHPRMLGDERVRLSDLAAVIPQMKNRPLVTNVTRSGKALLRLDFVSADKPGEFLYYLIRPDQGYLAEEIGKVSAGRYVFRTQVTNGQTKDGTWIPAKRDRVQFDATGRITVRENWYYRSMTVNEQLPRRMLSLNFFLLPGNAKVSSPRQSNAPKQ